VLDLEVNGAVGDDLTRQGFTITDDILGRILEGLSYSLQAPAKEPRSIPARP
jgi:hypothetical protein